MAKDLNVCMLLDFYGDVLTPKQRELMEFYYDQDLSLSEISENEGITRQGVHDAIRRSEQVLREMEEKLALVSRFGQARAQAAEIARLAADIIEENRQYCYSTRMGQQAEAIVSLAEEIRQGI